VPARKSKSWTVAGAARFARDARIATAEHLRSASIAREVQAARMEHAFDVHRAGSGGSSAEAVVMLFGGLGFAPPYPNMTDTVEQILQSEVTALRAAQLYVLSPQMCDVVVAAAQTLTAGCLVLVLTPLR
jgi:hypothetical protein